MPFSMGPNQLASANSRRPFHFLCLGQVRCSLASSELGSPAAVAERERWAQSALNAMGLRKVNLLCDESLVVVNSFTS
jgi:hypothetical protein